jgi:hypothetical protein
LVSLLLVSGCAYGSPVEDQTLYGHTKGHGGDTNDGGVDNLGSDPSTNIPNGCALEKLIEHGVIIDEWIVCSPTGFEWWRNIPDPAPDHEDKHG